MKLTKEAIRNDLKQFLKSINKEKSAEQTININKLFSYLVATRKFECTFRDLFACYLQTKYSEEYLVLPEHLLRIKDKRKSVDICFLRRDTDKQPDPVLIIEIKHYCSFNSDNLKKYIEKYLVERLDNIVPEWKGAVGVGIMLINHVDASLETLKDCKIKKFKYCSNYLKRKNDHVSNDFDDIKDEIKRVDYELLEGSVIKGAFKFNEVDEVNTKFLAAISK